MRNNTLKLYSIVCILLFVSVIYAGKVGIIVNKSLYSLIKTSLDTYIEDVKQIEKKDVWLESSTYDETSSPDDLKSDIKDHYDTDELEGVIFIGDLPIVNHEDDNKYHPCDWWWMDLDGVWGGSNYNFNSHTGDREMEIWHSRITTGVHPDLGSEEKIVNDYLARVHERMRGQDNHGRRLCIIGHKSEWSGLESENINSLNSVYPSDKTSTYSGGTCTPENWQKEQESGDMEFGFLYSHSSATSHSTPSWSYTKQVGIDADGLFYHLFACSNARYTGKNLSGLYGYGGYGLIGFGSTKTGSMRPGGFAAFNKPLTEGKSFGEAFMDWASTEGIKDHDWNYGMCVQGVGTLRLEPYASGPYISVAYPNGGEEWEQGTTYEIKWSSNVSGNVKIELLKGGAVNKELAASVANNGSFDVEITQDFTVGDDYKIKITSVENDTVLNESAQNFNIIKEYIIAEYPHVQNFDEWELGRGLEEKWEQIDGDDFNWIVHTGPTPSKTGSDPDKTGPDADHTTMSGKYVYLEASDPNSPQKEAGMISPKFNLSQLNDPRLTFWAHMFSADNDMGNLYVDICVDGVWKDEVIHLKDDHGDDWFEVKQELSDYLGDRVRFRLRGITGETWCGDICVDDFTIDGVSPIGKKIKNLPSVFALRYYCSRVYFQIPERVNKKPLSIKLYNVQGKLVRTLVQGNVESGYHSLPVNNEKGRQIAAGLYLCRMEAKGFTKTISVVISK